ncbi:peptide deformylase [Hyunsoonleella pacifica]|uniref:Peptide deformylase n=1 Tax=Hyunsoonleella pacifica TaxID=1080224 RepID=A0A4Q9FKY8_9FLAO|nr:peptide deformylase [Hyunsoonleella pacifica]TBN14471.1 peptide deformylase [Hyunsoonleella pacifica]GGD13989.1 peptide deformylase [Hyunsoonleella pacifica]
MKKIIFFAFSILLISGCSSSKYLKSFSFSSEEKQLITNGDSLAPMRVYKISSTTDSLVLRTKSTYIKPDPENIVLKKFVKRLYTTVRDSMSMGVGIAAPQVGILKNIIWVQRLDKEGLPFEVYLNPKIINYSTTTQTVREGCLSIPDRSETLSSRSEKIIIEYDTMQGQYKSETVEGFTAVIFQHEIDHLNGILYLDHLQKELKN